jgi:hypothetical protein
MNMSARLNQEDLKNLIREAMEAHTGRKVANIEFSLVESTEDWVHSSVRTVNLTGCTVNFVEEPLAMKPRVSRAPSNADHNTSQWGDH